MSDALRSPASSSLRCTVPRSAPLPASSQARAMASSMSAASMSSMRPRLRHMRPITAASMEKHSSR